MNIYICLLFVILITLIDFFFNMSKEAIMTANISRIKQLAEDDNKKASILAELRSGQKPFLLTTLHTLCTMCLFSLSLLSLDVIYPRVRRVFDLWDLFSGAFEKWIPLVCTAL